MRYILMTVIVALGLSAAGCTDDDRNGQGAAQSYQRLHTRLEQTLDELGSDIHDLSRLADNATGEAAATFRRRLEDLREKRADLDARLEGLRQKGSQTLDEARLRIGSALEQLRQEYRELRRYASQRLQS